MRRITSACLLLVLIPFLYAQTPTPPWATPPPDAGVTAEVIVVNSFDELKQLGRNKVAGKIVLFNVAYDHQKADAGQAGAAYGEVVRYRSAGASEAAQLGAVGSLVRSAGD